MELPEGDAVSTLSVRVNVEALTNPGHSDAIFDVYEIYLQSSNGLAVSVRDASVDEDVPSGSRTAACDHCRKKGAGVRDSSAHRDR